MNHLITRDAMIQFDVGPAGSHAWIANGGRHGMASVSMMLAEIQPGEGAPLHRHTYDEAFVVHEGEVTFTIGDAQVRAVAGEIVQVPAGTPHGFVNTGAVVMRQTAVHMAPKVEIEWLTPDHP